MFDLFDTSPYTFLLLESGSGGNKILEEVEATGIVKLRDGMVQVDNMEAFDSTSSVHIRPDETFISSLSGNLVGHGIRVNGVDYRIEGQTVGKDFDSGQIEFYRVTLKRESIWEPSDLPLE